MNRFRTRYRTQLHRAGARLQLLVLTALITGCSLFDDDGPTGDGELAPIGAPVAVQACPLAVPQAPRGGNGFGNGTDCDMGKASQEAIDNLGIQVCPQGTCGNAGCAAGLRCLPTTEADVNAPNPMQVTCRQNRSGVCQSGKIWSCTARGDWVCGCNCRP